MWSSESSTFLVVLVVLGEKSARAPWHGPSQPAHNLRRRAPEGPDGRPTGSAVTYTVTLLHCGRYVRRGTATRRESPVSRQRRPKEADD